MYRSFSYSYIVTWAARACSTCPQFLRNFYSGFGLILQSACLLVLTPMISLADISDLDTLELLEQPFPYEAKDMSAESTLQDFSRLTGLPVDGVLAGSVTVENNGGNASDFLDTLSEQTASVWWFDGLAIRVEPRAAMRSVVMGTRGIDISTLDAAMSFTGLANKRFATRMSPDGSLFNVVGPSGYVEAVEDLLDEIIAARKNRRVGLPVVYRGQLTPEREKERPAIQTAGSIRPRSEDER